MLLGTTFAGISLTLEGGYLDKLLEVGRLVGLVLDEGGAVKLAAAEADVGLYVCQLRRQDVAH